VGEVFFWGGCLWAFFLYLFLGFFVFFFWGFFRGVGFFFFGFHGVLLEWSLFGVILFVPCVCFWGEGGLAFGFCFFFFFFFFEVFFLDVVLRFFSGFFGLFRWGLFFFFFFFFFFGFFMFFFFLLPPFFFCFSRYSSFFPLLAGLP